MDNYLIISYPAGGGIRITTEYNGSRRSMLYLFYTKKDAIKEHRARYGLQHKHFITVEY